MPIVSMTAFPPQTAALQIAPPLARHVNGDTVTQRLRFYRGRPLTAAALLLEARNLESRFALTARVLADGVVDGFQVALADQASRPGGFTLGPGYAIAPSGHDLTLGHPVTLDFNRLPRHLAQDANNVPANLAGVGVLVLEPVAAQETVLPPDPAQDRAFRREQQLDPGFAPFADARITDGLRVKLVFLDALAGLATARDGLNRATDAVIKAEAQGAPLARHARHAVAVALIGFDAAGRVLWIGRHGAARRGGGMPPLLPMNTGGSAVPPPLGQACLDALLEQVTQIRRADPAAALVRQQFRNLPPAGLLPTRVVAPSGSDTLPGMVEMSLPLFPPQWAQSLSPVPIGQLDSILAAASALQGYDLDQAVDAVHWYVPVPDALFDLELLQRPVVDAGFGNAVAAYQGKLALARANRGLLRDQAVAVLGPIDNATSVQFPPDTDTVPGEDGFTAIGTASAPRFDTEASAVVTDWLAKISPSLLSPLQRDLGTLTGAMPASGRRGLAPLISDLDGAISKADDFIDFGYTRVQADIYRLRQSILDNDEATKLATFPVLAGIAKGSNAMATNRGLLDHFKSAKATVAAPAPVQDPPADAPAFLGGTMMAVRLLPLTVNFASTTTNDTSAGGGTAIGGISYVDRHVLADTAFKYSAQGYATTLETSSAKYVDVFNESRAMAVDELAFSSVMETRAGITLASAIPGASRDLRTVTIAARLEESAAVSARLSALRVKADTLNTLNGLGLGLGGVVAPIVALLADCAVMTLQRYDAFHTSLLGSAALTGLANAMKAGLITLSHGDTSGMDVVMVNFADPAVKTLLTQPATNGGLSAEAATVAQAHVDAMRREHSPIFAPRVPAGKPGLADMVLNRVLDPDPDDNTDEGAFLSAAVSILESVVAIFRATEQRVLVIRAFLEQTTDALAKLQGIADRWRAALALADHTLAEARHDLRVAMALLTEETARIEALRLHRIGVIVDHVKVLAYARPRVLRAHGKGTTTGRMLPGVYADPLPAALAQSAPLPGDLAKMMATLRDVPVGWFAASAQIMAGYQSPKVLDDAFHWAAQSAAVRLLSQQSIAMAQPTPPVTETKRGRARQVTTRIIKQYGALSNRLLGLRGGTDLSQIAAQGWMEKRKQAEVVLSLNDLIVGGGDTANSKAALTELDHIARITAALFARLRNAPAAVRLIWADTLSVYDSKPGLHDIATLPGWYDLDAGARSDLAALHGWLFHRMTPGNPEAQALMSDVVQVAILMAAHGETDDIVAARVVTEINVAASDVVELTLDRGIAPVGARVWFTLAPGRMVSGTIRDILGGKAKVEMAADLGPSVTLRPTTAVFVDSLGRGPAGYAR